MTTKLQTLINSAQELSLLEQVELIRAVFQFLYQSYQKELSATNPLHPPTGSTTRGRSSFWHPLTLEEIVQAQQTPVIQDISALQVDFWPKEETADAFIEYIYQQRKEDSLLEQ